LSLPATVGARPSEIVTLKKAEVNIGDQYLMLKVKGNWFKRTPISNTSFSTNGAPDRYLMDSANGP
jgi:hypothetical protein